MGAGSALAWTKEWTPDPQARQRQKQRQEEILQKTKKDAAKAAARAATRAANIASANARAQVEAARAVRKIPAVICRPRNQRRHDEVRLTSTGHRVVWVDTDDKLDATTRSASSCAAADKAEQAQRAMPTYVEPEVADEDFWVGGGGSADDDVVCLTTGNVYRQGDGYWKVEKEKKKRKRDAGHATTGYLQHSYPQARDEGVVVVDGDSDVTTARSPDLIRLDGWRSGVLMTAAACGNACGTACASFLTTIDLEEEAKATTACALLELKERVQQANDRNEAYRTPVEEQYVPAGPEPEGEPDDDVAIIDVVDDVVVQRKKK